MSAKSFVRKGLPILFSFAVLAVGLVLALGSLNGGFRAGQSSTAGTSTSGAARSTTGAGDMSGMAGSSMNMTTSGSTSNGPRAAVVLNYSIVGADDGNVGPDGKKHDTFVALNPMPIQAGQPVTISIKSTDEMPHSMTSPELGLNIMVPAAKDGTPGTVDFTFTPAKPGVYRWYCAIPCDDDAHGWAMTPGAKGFGQEGFMAGTISVQ
jgi:heme/copper-type cytochrome/quinol oxidase subunit 2